MRISNALQIPGTFHAITKLMGTGKPRRDLPSTGGAGTDTGNPRLDRSAECIAAWQQLAGFSTINGRVRLHQRESSR